MILVYIGFSFILGVILGCNIALPIVLQVVKGVNKSSYDNGVQDTLERFKESKNGNNKKTN